jgi:hypothetical protein
LNDPFRTVPEPVAELMLPPGIELSVALKAPLGPIVPVIVPKRPESRLKVMTPGERRSADASKGLRA